MPLPASSPPSAYCRPWFCCRCWAASSCCGRTPGCSAWPSRPASRWHGRSWVGSSAAALSPRPAPAPSPRTSERTNMDYDYIIVGSGIAGLYAALLAREHGSVLVITKGSVDDCNTRWAQGGIAAPIAAGPPAPPAEPADRIDDLVRFGVPFDTQHGEIALAREGAHSAPRVLHAGGDSTGAHIELTLSSLAQHSKITVLEFTLATEIVLESGADVGAHGHAPLQVVRGVRALDERTGRTTDYACRHLVLATGGAGQLYRVSTNPEVATGNGIAIAYRAGAEIMDMEFIQFHPTALRLPGAPAFLISEAVRGEGGVLRDGDGRRFMPDYHPQAELAPRDVVARAIVAEMVR